SAVQRAGSARPDNNGADILRHRAEEPAPYRSRAVVRPGPEHSGAPGAMQVRLTLAAGPEFTWNRAVHHGAGDQKRNACRTSRARCVRMSALPLPPHRGAVTLTHHAIPAGVDGDTGPEAP